MLRKARPVRATALVAGTADALPWRAATFDVVFCVNALHHFDDPQAFVRAARALLRSGGGLALIGMNPHASRDQWYVYDYFPGTYDADLERFPSPGMITDWMIGAGFHSVAWRVVERIRATRTGRAMLSEPMLQKNATSQLTLLSDDAYAAGVARIRAAIERAEARGEEQRFSIDVALHMDEEARESVRECRRATLSGEDVLARAALRG